MDLSITVNGIKFPNPFLLGSGPPGTNARVIAKSFDAGWGGAVAKTVSLESSKVVNVVPRYGKLRSRNNGEVIGFENIELISDRPIEVWLEEFRQIQTQDPNSAAAHMLSGEALDGLARTPEAIVEFEAAAAGVVEEAAVAEPAAGSDFAGWAAAFGSAPAGEFGTISLILSFSTSTYP